MGFRHSSIGPVETRLVERCLLPTIYLKSPQDQHGNSTQHASILQWSSLAYT